VVGATGDRGPVTAAWQIAAAAAGATGDRGPVTAAWQIAAAVAGATGDRGPATGRLADRPKPWWPRSAAGE
jgi:hypothetical protein